MNLKELTATIDGLTLTGNAPDIRGLTADSRQVEPGFLFAALRGSREDGGRFITEALTRGAAAVLHDGGPGLPHDVPQAVHAEPRLALALMAARFFGHPAERMNLVGVTGTNGKSTVVAMLATLFETAGVRAGSIGTLGVRGPGLSLPGVHTTPEPVTLHGHLLALADAGTEVVAMEVSSHALDQWRVGGLSFAAGVFTNLSRDHLDYHGEMERYFQAKCRLFLEMDTEKAVVNLADEWGRKLAARIRAFAEVIGFGLPGASFQAREIHAAWERTRFTLVTPDGEWPVSMPAAGGFNVENAMAAAAAAWAVGLRGGNLVEGFHRFQGIRGRLERVEAGQPFAVVVDYAHTPDGLLRLLWTARELTGGRLLLVFGCGGERDAGKRAIMGEIATRLADVVMVTDDNPRSEDPALIRRQILSGCRGRAGKAREIGDRRQAIAAALHLAKPGDAVLLAGKGHETVQVVGAVKHPFDDRAVAREELAVLGWRAVEQAQNGETG